MITVQEEKKDSGKISDEDIIRLAVNTTLKITGVRRLSGGITDSISKNILGKEPLSKGIKFSRTDDGIMADIYVIVDYLAKIPQLAWDIQSSVKEALEEATDIPVLEVNIHVQGVDLPGEEEKNDENRC